MKSFLHYGWIPLIMLSMFLSGWGMGSAAARRKFAPLIRHLSEDTAACTEQLRESDAMMKHALEQLRKCSALFRQEP